MRTPTSFPVWAMQATASSVLSKISKKDGNKRTPAGCKPAGVLLTFADCAADRRGYRCGDEYKRQVYKDYTSMRGFMDRAYNFLDNFHSYQNCNNGRTHIGAISDEFASLFNSAESKVVNSGNWLSKDGTDFEIGNGSNGNGTSIWKAYKGLRIVNRVRCV